MASDLTGSGARVAHLARPVAPLPMVAIDAQDDEPVTPVVPAWATTIGRPTLLYGLPGAGKSMGLIATAVDIVAGGGRVDWIDGEMGPMLRYRIRRHARVRGVDLGGRLRTISYPALSLDDPRAVDILSVTCDGRTLLVFETMTSLSNVDDTTPDAGRVPLMLGRVSARTRAGVILVHHARRDGDLRGSTAIGAACESIWRVRARGRDIVCEHERSPIGAPLPDRTYRVQDVEIDGDPLGGLAIDDLSATPAQEADRHSIDLEDRIMEYLDREGGHTGGARSIATTLSVRQATVQAAISRMSQAGRVRVVGAARARRIEVVR